MQECVCESEKEKERERTWWRKKDCAVSLKMESKAYKNQI